VLGASLTVKGALYFEDQGQGEVCLSIEEESEAGTSGGVFRGVSAREL
jgi:hypothetical protein